MIRRFELADGSVVPTESPDAAILVYLQPDPDERGSLQTTFDLDEHAISSALDPDEVSRIEFGGDRMFLIWKRPTNYSGKEGFFFDVSSVGLLVLPKRLAVITTDEIHLLPPGIRHAPPAATPFGVTLRLLFGTVQHYLAHLKVIKMIARELQQKINTSMENKHLIQMFNLSESLVFYINAIHSNAVVLTRLRAHVEREGASPEVVAFVDDLMIENTQCLKQAEIYSTVFSGLMDARGNLVNNNMNTLLKNLTIINVVFLPLNLIAGIGGMSEFTMMTQGWDWRITYSVFCLAMVAVGWLTAVVLRRMNPAGPPPRRPRRD